MAIKTITILEDDLDGSKAEETLTFTLDGTAYEIDLNADHAEELRSILSPYAKAGRKLKNSARSAKRTAASSHQPTAAEVRTWAQTQGLPVSIRGRVQADILDKYRVANLIHG
ncbi:Lsr2 family protein [Pseudarthrobacter oxydans]|uniref:histone-like nucleoid-structuring protein Lsr2 n=1 Tax=Pseudarthrobacter oxydans TaxID=1671 RepID=UPI003ED0E3F8